MRRILRPVIALAILGGLLAALYFYEQRADDTRWHGYIEGEYVRIGAAQAGFLDRLSVERGEQIAAGAPLFAMDLTTAEAERDRAAATLAEDRARLADLRKGERPEEMAMRRAQLEEAEASLVRTRAELARQEALAAEDFASRSRLDEARAAYERDRARVSELRAGLAVGALPAREDAIKAAEAAAAEAEASLAAARRRLAELAPAAPVAALVEDTFFLPGEWVPAGATVVSLLPPEKRKLRFFVPQDAVARLAPGLRLAFSCDGCPAGLEAEVSYVAPEAEFTPPVIYSRSARQKLVFLIEARPLGSTVLPVGLPVEVVPPS